MTSPEIQLNPGEASGTMTKVSGQLASGASAMPQAPAGLDSRIAAAVGDQITNSQQAVAGAVNTAENSKTGVDGLANQDQANGRKIDGVDSALKDRAGNGRGGEGPGRLGRADTPRLSGSDLAKLAGAGQYQSPMPAMQSAPSMPQMPQMPAMPTSGASAPIQSMLGAPGAISPLLGKLMSTGGPASQPMGAQLPGQAGKLQDLVSKTVGVPYAWGGGALDGPSRGIHDGGGPADRAGDYNKIGFDCSGYARYITFQLTGHEIERTSQAQYATGMPISASQARPGDLVFPSSSFGNGGPGHVQVYLGNNQVAEAPSSGQTVKISPLRPGEFRRMVA